MKRRKGGEDQRVMEMGELEKRRKVGDEGEDGVSEKWKVEEGNLV